MTVLLLCIRELNHETDMYTQIGVFYSFANQPHYLVWCVLGKQNQSWQSWEQLVLDLFPLQALYHWEVYISLDAWSETVVQHFLEVQGVELLLVQL